MSLALFEKSHKESMAALESEITEFDDGAGTGEITALSVRPTQLGEKHHGSRV